MSLIPIDAAHIAQTIQNDANQMRTMISWLEQRNVTYGQNMTTANMTTASIAAGDQTAILAFIADVSRLVTFLHGTLPGVAADCRIDIAGVLGVM
jgi:ribosomal protein L18